MHTQKGKHEQRLRLWVWLTCRTWPLINQERPEDQQDGKWNLTFVNTLLLLCDRAYLFVCNGAYIRERKRTHPFFIFNLKVGLLLLGSSSSSVSEGSHAITRVNVVNITSAISKTTNLPSDALEDFMHSWHLCPHPVMSSYNFINIFNVSQTTMVENHGCKLQRSIPSPQILSLTIFS